MQKTKKQKKYQINRSKFLSEKEQKQLDETLRKLLKESHTNKRDVIMIRVALATGARANEVLAIRPRDINHTDKAVTIYGLKGSNDREIPLPEDLYEDLNWLAQTCRVERVFEVSYRRLVQIWDKVKPSEKSFHSLRHTFAINLFKRTRDVRLVQVALGHTSITNTMVYADYVYSTNELKQIIA